MVEMKKSEMGQALVLIVIGIVGLLGFAALAIDGGRVYIDRRTMQNASDTASLTGGLEYIKYFDANAIHYENGWNCSSLTAGADMQAKAAAIDRAQSNGYVVDTTVDESNGDFNGVRTTCYSEDLGGFVDKYIEVETFVTSITPSSFAQFVFGGPLQQTVISMARVRPQTTIAFGAAIVALNESNCSGNQNGVQFDGSQNVFVNGGGIISNGCLGKNGSGDVTVSDGSISWGGDPTDYTKVGPGAVSPNPEQNSQSLPDNVTNIPAPDCASLPTYGAINSNANLTPGNYTTINVGSNETVFMNPGLYCISGDVDVSGQGKLIGNGVTIYIINGDFDTSGGSYVDLSAPSATPDPDPALVSLLIYLARGNNGSVNMLGNASSRYLGTVYAPDGEIEVGGTSSLIQSFNTQLIGYNVFVHGDATIDIVNDDAASYQTPPTIDLQK